MHIICDYLATLITYIIFSQNLCQLMQKKNTCHFKVKKTNFQGLYNMEHIA